MTIVIQEHKIKLNTIDNDFYNEFDDLDYDLFKNVGDNPYLTDSISIDAPLINKMVIPRWWPCLNYESRNPMPIPIWDTPKIHYTKEINNIINTLTNLSDLPKEIIDIIIEYTVHFDGPPFSWVKILEFKYCDRGVDDWIEFAKLLEYFPNMEKLYIRQNYTMANSCDDFYQFIKLVYSNKHMKVLVLIDSQSNFIPHLITDELFKYMSNNSTILISRIIDSCEKWHGGKINEFIVTTQGTKRIIFLLEPVNKDCDFSEEEIFDFANS